MSAVRAVPSAAAVQAAYAVSERRPEESRTACLERALRAAYAVDFPGSVLASPGAPSPADEFFRRCWEAALDAREIEGSDVQDWGYELGLLTKVVAPAPCGDGCVCADLGADFPTDCYRPASRVGLGAPP